MGKKLPPNTYVDARAPIAVTNRSKSEKLASDRIKDSYKKDDKLKKAMPVYMRDSEKDFKMPLEKGQGDDFTSSGLSMSVQSHLDDIMHHASIQAENSHIDRNATTLKKAAGDWAETKHVAALDNKDAPEDNALQEFQKQWSSAPYHNGKKGFGILSPGESNPKVAKGMGSDEAGVDKTDYHAAILHMSPANISGFGQMCAAASPGCIRGCLNLAGRGGMLSDEMNTIQIARSAKTKLFADHPKEFWTILTADINNHIKDAAKEGKKPALRLNGTSDIAWEKIRPPELKGMNVFEAFPDVQFWDYTKRPERLPKNKHENYNLTFSLSEKNAGVAKKLLDMGHNVAAVMGAIKPARSGKKGGELPSQFNVSSGAYNVLDGDETDFRFLDKKDSKGHVVALRPKGDAMYDFSGFAQYGHDKVDPKMITKIMAKLGFDPRDKEKASAADREAAKTAFVNFNKLHEILKQPAATTSVENRTKKFLDLAVKTKELLQNRKNSEAKKAGKPLKKSESLEKSKDKQYHVSFKSFPPDPKLSRGGSWAAWKLDKKQIAHILKNWDSEAQWDYSMEGKKTRAEGRHSSALPRTKTNAPVQHMISKGELPSDQSILYHGVGQDWPTARALSGNDPAKHNVDYRSINNINQVADLVRGGKNKVEMYDKFSDYPELTKLPEGQYDQVHSHYTLNVVDKDIGKQVLKEIHSKLKDNGKAIITARRDEGVTKHMKKPLNKAKQEDHISPKTKRLIREDRRVEMASNPDKLKQKEAQKNKSLKKSVNPLSVNPLNEKIKKDHARWAEDSRKKSDHWKKQANLYPDGHPQRREYEDNAVKFHEKARWHDKLSGKSDDLKKQDDINPAVASIQSRFARPKPAAPEAPAPADSGGGWMDSFSNAFGGALGQKIGKSEDSLEKDMSTGIGAISFIKKFTGKSKK